MSIGLNGKFCKIMVRLAMIYRSKSWAVNKNIEQKMRVAAETRMVRKVDEWSNYREDKIKNQYIEVVYCIGVALIVDKIQ